MDTNTKPFCLVVEDDPNVRELLGMFSSSAGFTPLYLLPPQNSPFSLDWLANHESSLSPLGCLLSASNKERRSPEHYKLARVQAVIADFVLWDNVTANRLLAALRYHLPQARILAISGQTTQIACGETTLFQQANITYGTKPVATSFIMSTIKSQNVLPPVDPQVLAKIFKARLLTEVT